MEVCGYCRQQEALQSHRGGGGKTCAPVTALMVKGEGAQKQRTHTLTKECICRQCGDRGVGGQGGRGGRGGSGGLVVWA